MMMEENNTEIPSLLRKRIDEWRSRLIDLSKRNQLLNYRKTKSSTLEFEQQDSDFIYSRITTENGAWRIFSPLSDETDEEQNKNGQIALELSTNEELAPEEDELVSTETDSSQIKRILTNLLRKSREEYQERGVHVLHLGFGMLKWVDPQSNHSDVFHSPLLLCPVVLNHENANLPLTLTLAEEGFLINPALQVKLKRDFNVELPDLLEEDVNEPISIYLEQVRKWLAIDGWEVADKTVLGLFSFEKLGMYQDLEKNADHLANHQVILGLAGVDRQYADTAGEIQNLDLDEYQKPEKTFQILDADSSQQQCIQAVLQGHSLVLQGPPGTGKSQTIANIIAEFLARKKTVLFVSEKMAALEVVYKRLADKKLENYCLELHSRKANKKEVLNTLFEAAETSLKPPMLPSEEDYHRMQSLRQQLNEYVNALHESRQELGCSVYETMEKVSKNIAAPLLNIGVEVERLTTENYQAWQKELKALSLVWNVALEGDAFPWRGCGERYFGPDVRDKWSKLLPALQESLISLCAGANVYSQKTGLPLAVTLEDVYWLIEVAELIDKGVVPAALWLTTYEMNDILEEAKKYGALSRQYWQLKQELEQVVNAEFFLVENGKKAELSGLWEKTKILFPVLDADGFAFQAQYRELTSFVTTLPKELQECRQYAAGLLDATGANLPIDRAAGIFKLAEIVSYSFQDLKPEKEWLAQKAWKTVSELVESVKPLYFEYNQKRAELLGRYEENIFDINTTSFLERFHSWSYSGVFKILNPGYYAAKKEIIRCTKDFCMPEDIVADLLSVRTVQSLKDKIDAGSDELRSALGAYYCGAATNFDEVEKGLEIASALIALNDNEAYSDSLSSYLSNAATVPNQYKNIVDTLLKKQTEWIKLEESLQYCIDSDNLLGNGMPLRQISLADLCDWSNERSKMLMDISLQIDGLLACCLQMPSCISDLVNNLEKLSQLRSIQTAVQLESDNLKNHFGYRFNGVTTEWDEVMVAIDWTLQLRDLLTNEKMSPAVVQYLTNLERSPENESMQLKRLLSSFDLFFTNQFKVAFEDGRPMINGETRLDRIELRELLAFFRLLEKRIDELDNWVEYVQRRASLSAQGLESFVAQAEKEIKEGAAVLVEAYSRAFYQAQVNAVFSTDSRLMNFRGKGHQQVIEEFRDLDRKLIAQAPLAIIEACNQNKPNGNNIIASSSAEINVLKSEAAKKRRHMPLLKLFQKIPNLLLKLKPCLMMSPLSVSQYIEPDCFSFDLVIFDEASQIFTEDAVVAMYRGKQVVIAGDSKQMPPTNFFQAVEAGDAEYDEDEEETVTSSADFSSVLDECTPIFPTSMLRWHYRSKHESLIAFSNQQFYGNKLITFPSAVQKSDAFGVQFEFVENGIYARGKQNAINRIEAQRVAEIVVEHFRRWPQKSIGVVAFSKTQMLAIQDVLDNMRQKDPSLETLFKEDRLNGFFCKNLENVQGDERDTIIFSVGYGKDAQGRLSMNFGPLNKDGGERRLNVAITRAREKVILVSSIKAGDMNLSTTKAAGVLNLYKYLQFAELGDQALELTGPEGREDTDSPFEDDVIQVIRQMGYTPIPQVGCSGYRIDIGVTRPDQPGKFILGVECDGRTYHSAPTARDRDRLRQQVLEGLGWKIYRIWSPDWFQRREAEIERLNQAIQAATNEAPKVDKIDSLKKYDVDIPTVDISCDPTSDNALLPGVVPYQVYTVDSPSWEYDFNAEEALPWHIRNIGKLTKQEGPIHFDVVAKRLADAWSLARVGARIKQTVKAACLEAERNGAICIKEDGFLWPEPFSQELQVRVPFGSCAADVRKIDYIPDAEICRAMQLVLEQAVGISRENLIQETAHLFGFSRSGEKIYERLDGCVEYCLNNGSIIMTGETLALVN